MKNANCTASSLVLEFIKGKLGSGEWKKGDKIFTETQLMETVGVGRPAVREAIEQLVAVHVLTKIQGNGTYVNESSINPMLSQLIPYLLFDEYDALTVLEFRKIIEPECIKMFIETQTAEEITELDNCIFEMQKSEFKDNEKFYKADFQFHIIVVKGTQNPLVAKIMDILKEVFFSYQYTSNQAIGPKTGLEEHRQVLRAIKMRDKELASLLMRRHIERSERDMKDFLNNKIK